MTLLKLSRLNLNLLVCLQALLEERNVSKAARRLCVSPSAVSKYLAQLRQMTSDPLFTRTAHGLTPTERALKIQQELAPLLDSMLEIIQPEQFSPAVCDRYFRIALPETVSHAYFKWCLPAILNKAPHVKMKIQNLTLDNLHDLASGRLDFVLIPHDLDCGQNKMAGLHCRKLHKDKLVCLVRQGHPCLNEEWNLDSWLKLNHVGIGTVTSGPLLVDQALAKQDRSRMVVSAVDSFHSATDVCENTDLAVISSQVWAHYAQEKFAVTALPIPIPVEPISYELYWHERNHQDSAHRWLRDFSLDIAKNIGLKPNCPVPDCLIA